MRTRFLNASLLALFCVSAAVISGCSSPDGTAPFDPQGEWGLTYGSTIQLQTKYSNSSLDRSITTSSSALGAPTPSDGGYNETDVFLYDPVAHTVTVGMPNPVTDGGGPEIASSVVFTLDSNNKATVTAGTAASFKAIAGTACGVSKNSVETIQFSADGSTLTISLAETETLIANTSGSGLSCAGYLTQEKAKVQASLTTDIPNYVDGFAEFLSNGAVNVPNMDTLTEFAINASFVGKRLTTSTNVPAAEQTRPSMEPTKFEFHVSDPRVIQMIQDLIHGTQLK